MASKKFVKEDEMSEAQVTKLWQNQGFGMTPRGLYDYAMGDNAAGNDIMEVALNGLAKHVREVKDTSAAHTVTLEEHAEAIAELGGSVATKGAEAKASLTVGDLQEIRGQLEELLAFRSAQEQEMSELRQRAVDAEAEAKAQRAAVDAAAATAADAGLADLKQQMEGLRLLLAEQQQLNADHTAKLEELVRARDSNATEAPWINYDASAKPTSAKPSSRDGASRGGSSLGSRGASRSGRSGGGLGIGDAIGGVAVGDPSDVLQGPDGPMYEGDRPFSVVGAAESTTGLSVDRTLDASQVGPSFNSLSTTTAANTRAIEELMDLKNSIEQAVGAASSATSQTAAVAMQGASLKAQLMAIATEMHGQKERIIALEGGGKGPTLAATQTSLADLSAKSQESFAQLQQLMLDVARLQGKQERARTPWGTNAVVAPGTPLGQALPTVSKAETGLVSAMASGDPVAVATAQADLAKSRATASEAEVSEAEMAVKKATADKEAAEAAIQAAKASGDAEAVAAAEAQLVKTTQEAKLAEQARAAAQVQAEVERTALAETQAAVEREIQSRGSRAGTAGTKTSRSSRGGSGDGPTEHLRTGELALLKLDNHQQEIEDRMAAETDARAAAIAHCEEALKALGNDVNGMRSNLQDASETLREKAERFDVDKLEVSMIELKDLIQMLAGRAAGASQAEAALEMHQAERARMEEMIAEHGDQLQALFSASASKEDVDAAANLVAEMDRKLATEMEAKAATLMKQLQESQESMESHLNHLGDSVAAKADVEWSKAMESKIRADVAASSDSEEMKNRRLKRQLKTLQEKLSIMAGSSMRESGTWRSYHAIFNRCLACNNPLNGSNSSWQTANVLNPGLSGAPGFASPSGAAEGLGLQAASNTQNRSESPPKRASVTSGRIPMKEDHAEVIMKGGFPMANPKAKTRSKLDRAKAKASGVSGLSLSGMGGAT